MYVAGYGSATQREMSQARCSMKIREMKKVLRLQPTLDNGMVLVDPKLFDGCKIPIYQFYTDRLRRAGYRPATEDERSQVRLEICKGLSTCERLIVLSGEPYESEAGRGGYAYSGVCYLWISRSWSTGTAKLFDYDKSNPLRFFDSTICTLLQESRVRLLVVKL